MHPPTTERRGRSEPPTWLTRLLALFQPRLQDLVPQLNVLPPRKWHHGRDELGWSPRSSEDTVTASAESLIRLGLLK